MTKGLNRLAMLLITVPLILGCSARAYGAEETLISETQFETTNKQEDRADSFPKTQEKNGVAYILKSVTTEVLEEVPVQQDILTLDGESFVGDPEEHRPQEMVEKDGRTYRLKDYGYIDTQLEERTQEVSAVIPYTAVEYIDTLPETGEVDAEDENTHQRIAASLPYKSHTASEAYWDKGFLVPLTVVSYDAETYELGDVEIPKDADLSLYGQELLAYLGLPEDYYRILDIQWQDEAYESNGEIRRDAIATGEKLVKDMEVTYAGQVTFPGIAAHAFNSVYEAVPSEGEADTMYTIKATATYVLDPTGATEGVSRQPWWRDLLDWIKDHPLLATICLALILLILWLIIFLFLLAKKRREEDATEIIIYEEEEEDDV